MRTSEKKREKKSADKKKNREKKEKKIFIYVYVDLFGVLRPHGDRKKSLSGFNYT
jgi:hypothetical protein